MPAKKSVVTDAERLATIAKTANQHATRADTKSPIPFGAPVSRPQIASVERYLAKRDILKFLACTEKQLRAFSRNEISYSALPTKTQQKLRLVSEQYSKPWARKSAAIAYALLIERRKRAKKPATPKPTSTVEPTAE